MENVNLTVDLEVHLPYYKQGDDLASHLEACGGDLKEALKSHAESLQSAVEQLYSILVKINSFPDAKFEVCADTHMIMFHDVPKELADVLVKNDLAEIAESYDEEDEDFEEESEEDSE